MSRPDEVIRLRKSQRSSRAILGGILLWCAWAAASAGAWEINLPRRPDGAPTGKEVAAAISALPIEAREQAVVAEILRGNVPDFWRRFVPVDLEGIRLEVAPDYLAVGTDEDPLLVPLRPLTAQALADRLGCLLPTRKIVDAIHRAAAIKLEPAPIPPGPAMTTAAMFADHNATVQAQREALRSRFPLGVLVAGHKKDVVITPRVAASPGKVAIYGWHRPDGSAIQPLYLGHGEGWVDYSHGIRLVAQAAEEGARPVSVAEVLADAKRCGKLSDEGPLLRPRYEPAPRVVAGTNETVDEWRFEPGVRVVVNAPATRTEGSTVRLVLYAAPAGSSIEHTFGRRLKPGDDWHFDIQHVAAQTRWLRERDPASHLIVACLQVDERSWVAWRRRPEGRPQRIAEIVEALRARYPGARLTLTGHSAGGTFTFGYLDALERIPDDIERIAFLDSNYAYDSAKGHATKLADWLEGSPDRRLCVLAYQDYVALLDGNTFVSENGGTWGRSLAMLRDLGARWPFSRQEAGGLQQHSALNGRVQFFLKENPERLILHTRQVEWNGLIHALWVGTPRQDHGYLYLGARVYSALITDE